MYPRTDLPYSYKSVPYANKPQSVLPKQSCCIEVASTDHTFTVLTAGFVLQFSNL